MNSSSCLKQLVRNAILLSVGILVFDWLAPIYAQQSDPPRLPSVPADSVFDASVQIRYVQPIADPMPFSYHNNFRLLDVGNQIIAYPAEILSIYSIHQIAEGYLFITGVISGDEHPVNRFREWLYDVTEGTLTDFEPRCPVDEQSRGAMRYSLPEQPWMLVTEEIDAYLCHAFTGERTPVLPSERGWLFETGLGTSPLISTSPDGQYVAIIGLIGEIGPYYSDYEVEIYSYVSGKADFNSLGVVDARFNLYFDRWIDTQVTIYSGSSADSDVSPRFIYIADAAQPDNVDYAISSYWTPRFFDDPPRYVVGHVESGAPCGRETFYVATRERVRLELDGLCWPEFGEPEGVGYYRDVPMGESFECCAPVPANIAEVPLIRYDARTGERQELYRGEIERIIWVSPDEKYAILWMDNSGKIDIYPYFQDIVNENWAHRMSLPTVWLVDLTNQRPLSAAYLHQIHFADPGLYWSQNNGIYPLPDGDFLHIDCAIPVLSCSGHLTQATRLTLTDNEVVETQLVSDPIILTPDRTGVFVWTRPATSSLRTDPPSSIQGINIYDLDSGEIQPLMRELSRDDYSIRLTVNDQRTATLTVSPRPPLSGRWAATNFNLIFEPDGEMYVEVNRPEIPAIGHIVCILTATTGVNLRAEPDGESERVGTAAQGEQLIGLDKVYGQGVDWWQLATGGFVHGGFVTTSRACDNLSEKGDDMLALPELLVEDENCQLIVLVGVNLRSGPGVDYERIGSAVVDSELIAKGYHVNEQDQLRWWWLVTDEWVREDFVQASSECDQLLATDP